MAGCQAESPSLPLPPMSVEAAGPQLGDTHAAHRCQMRGARAVPHIKLAGQAAVAAARQCGGRGSTKGSGGFKRGTRGVVQLCKARSCSEVGLRLAVRAGPHGGPHAPPASKKVLVAPATEYRTVLFVPRAPYVGPDPSPNIYKLLLAPDQALKAPCSGNCPLPCAHSITLPHPASPPSQPRCVRQSSP